MSAKLLFRTFVCLAAFSSPASAWYQEVHNQLGYVTDQLLNSNTKYMVAQILEAEYQGSVGRAASWADSVSRTTHPYSYNWHWISGHDDPPNSCSLHYHRDCGEDSCVVQQIHNQTEILKPCVAALANGMYEPNVDCRQALKWLVHFTMDICQPMHTSFKSRGGNDFKVTFNGTVVNMHQMWDRWILYSQTRHDSFPADHIDPYFQWLYERIRDEQSGQISFRQPMSQWWGESCSGATDRNTYCPELWAKDSNAIVCDYAYGRYVDGSDLYRDGYASGAFHIVQQQLAKAAWRTAGWLNTIASTYLDPKIFGENDASNPVDPVHVRAAEKGVAIGSESSQFVMKDSL